MQLKFNKGNPPHVGWWCCGEVGAKRDRYWRWWNGREWSSAVFEDQGQVLANLLSMAKHGSWSPIKWSHYYPENARVPRSQS